MKKYILSLFILSAGFLPLVSFGQVVDIDPAPGESGCVSLQNNLRYKSRDINTNGEVSTLQDFLQSQNYLSSEPTGYFGGLTLRAVKDFQSANGIVPTGYVGPLTRARISAITCGTSTTPPPPPPPTSLDLIINTSSKLPDAKVGQPYSIKLDATGGDGFYNWSTGFASFPVTGLGLVPAEVINCLYNSTGCPKDYARISGVPAKLYKDGVPINTQTFNFGLYVKSGSQKAYKDFSLTVFNEGTVESPSPIILLTPNGGETWMKGFTQIIKWSNANSVSYYEIKLAPYYPPCSGSVCPMYAYREPYTIAKTQGSSYDWLVGSSWNGTVPDGAYTMHVCQSGTNNCDSSDNYFKVTSGGTSACSLTAEVTNIFADSTNSGWGFDVVVNAKNPPSTSRGWLASFQGYAPSVTAYGVKKHYGNFFMTSGALKFSPVDEIDGLCVTTVTINPPTSVPIITSVIPGSSNAGAVVTINGYGFNTGNNGTIVYLGLNQIIVTAESQNKITFTIPAVDGSNLCKAGCVPTAPGNYKIWVRNNNATDPASNQLDFTVTAPQSSTSILIKNSASVPTQNISINLPNQVLGGFDVTTVGEPVSVKTMAFTLPIATDAAGAATLLSNVTLQDSNGSVVAGPVDAVQRNGQMTLAFTDTVTFPVGTKTYKLKGKLSSGLVGLDITVSTNPSTLWTGAVGQTTGNPVSLSSNTAFSMNKMNLLAGVQLSVSTDSSTPALAIVYAKQQSNVTMGVIRVRALNGAVILTGLNLKVTSGNVDEITNVSVWDGIYMIGSGAFSFNSNTLNLYLAPTLLSQDYDKRLVIKVSVVKVPSLISSVDVTTIVDVINITGTDVVSGYLVTGANSSGSFSGIIIK